jgi:hypothetical protein
MAAVTVYNHLAGLELQPGEKTVLKRNGISEKTSVFISYGDPGNPFIPLYTPYPDASTNGFVCDQVTKEALDAGFYKITVVWVSITVGPTSYTTFSSKLTQVPIAQSPNFTKIAGTPSAPLNGAVFDAQGQFVGFGPGAYQGVVTCFIRQDLEVVRGSDSKPGVAIPQLFCESIENTLRGNVWEYEIIYNLSLSNFGIPVSG